MISQKITAQIGEALKTGNEIRLSTLRLLSSALSYEKIEKQRDLSDEEEIAVVRREVKKRKEAIEAYKKGGAEERAEREEKEMKVLQEYLPAEMSDQELEEFVDVSISETGVKSVADMGKLMGVLMPHLKGKVGGDRVSEMVKKKLSG